MKKKEEKEKKKENQEKNNDRILYHPLMHMENSVQADYIIERVRI